MHSHERLIVVIIISLLLLLLLLLLGGIAESIQRFRLLQQRLPQCGLSVCMSVCHTLHLAKTVGRNEMPFSRDTHVVPSNIVLDRDPGPSEEGEIWVSVKSALQTVTDSGMVTDNL